MKPLIDLCVQADRLGRPLREIDVSERDETGADHARFFAGRSHRQGACGTTACNGASLRHRVIDDVLVDPVTTESIHTLQAGRVYL